jgi:hypothetical protein
MDIYTNFEKLCRKYYPIIDEAEKNGDHELAMKCDQIIAHAASRLDDQGAARSIQRNVREEINMLRYNPH